MFGTHVWYVFYFYLTTISKLKDSENYISVIYYSLQSLLETSNEFKLNLLNNFFLSLLCLKISFPI